MDSAAFSDALTWVIAQGYFLMFIGMFVEGPIVTAAASFAAALGFFNIGVVFVLAIAGDILADITYFVIGYWGRYRVIEKYGHYFYLTKLRIVKIQNHFKLHAGKTLLAVKLSPAPIPGLIAAGIAHMPLKKFVILALAITTPKVLFFMAIGFYFGNTYSTLNRFLGYAPYFLFTIAVLNLLIYFAFRKISASFANKIEPLESKK